MERNFQFYRTFYLDDGSAPAGDDILFVADITIATAEDICIEGLAGSNGKRDVEVVAQRERAVHVRPIACCLSYDDPQRTETHWKFWGRDEGETKRHCFGPTATECAAETGGDQPATREKHQMGC